MQKIAMIEVDTIGVHAAHCCKKHGCKYMDDDCPIVTGKVEQMYPCGECGSNLREAKDIFATLTGDERVEVMLDYCRHCGKADPRCRCWDDS